MFKDKSFLFFNFVIVYFIYAALSGVVIDKQSILSIIIPVGFFIYAIYINYLHYHHQKKVFNYLNIYLFLLFWFVLITYSSIFQYSLKQFIKAATPILFYIVAMYWVKDLNSLRRINKAMLALIALFVINIIVANIFDLGKVQYENEETIDVGNIYSIGLNSMAYALVLFPLFLYNYKFKNKYYKSFYFSLSIVTLIIMLILMKRGALVGLLTGYLIWFLTSNFKYKSRLLQSLFILTLVLIVSYPLYSHYLISRFEVRKERIRMDSYETEGRYMENQIVIDEILSFKDVKYSLIGREMFNSPGNYAQGKFGQRQLHNDYARLLNGSGILGLLFYFFVQFVILRFYIQQKKKLKSLHVYGRFEKVLNSVFMSFFFMYFVIGISGGIDGTLYTGIRYIYLGAITALFKVKFNNVSNRDNREKNKLIRSRISVSRLT